MNAGLNAAVAPALAPGVKLRFDKVREGWVLLAPERLFVIDEQALDILKLVDGARTLKVIIDDLAERFDAPRDLIETDVVAMLRDLADRGAITL
ncbi:MAG: pqqD [Rhodospirillales bacterium]|nr:pqqD [Rhodospirillales bacterium]